MSVVSNVVIVTIPSLDEIKEQFVDIIRVKALTRLKFYDIEVRETRKWIRVEIFARMKTKERSIVAFIDPNTGDVYKPEGWTRPAKHVRGHINKLDECFDGIGIKHLRG